MPIEVGLWKIGDVPQRISYSAMETEKKLEDILSSDLSILDPGLLLIGRQVQTSFNKFIDLLALDREGQLVVIELKRDKTPREVVAQVLDYGSWVRNLEDDDIAEIYEGFTQKYDPSKTETSLDEAFSRHFKIDEMPEVLNESHELIVVAAELDDSTERIINYLTECGVAVNAVFFRFFKDGESEYLSRAWLIEPDQVEAKIEEKREKLPWNGEFYVSFGSAPNRNWDEAREHGFISAGGGSWYTKSLGMLHEGARIWVNVPGEGYVGVGEVLEEAVPVDQFLVNNGNGEKVPITKLNLKVSSSTSAQQNPEEAEHLVRVKWLNTLPLSHAIHEKGFFGNQNSAAKPRSKKWPHTVERLKTKLKISK